MEFRLWPLGFIERSDKKCYERSDKKCSDDIAYPFAE